MSDNKRPHRALQTPISGLAIPAGGSKTEMYLDGMRYGNPDMPRYCTGREAAPPAFPWPSGTRLEAGRQRR